jgi:hypothetical protein
MQKGDDVMQQIANNCKEYLDWYFSMPPSMRRNSSQQINYHLGILNTVLRICEQSNRTTVLDNYMPVMARYSQASELFPKR